MGAVMATEDTKWYKWLAAQKACKRGMAWLRKRQFGTPQEAWNACQNGPWMLGVLVAAGYTASSDFTSCLRRFARIDKSMWLLRNAGYYAHNPAYWRARRLLESQAIRTVFPNAPEIGPKVA